MKRGKWFMVVSIFLVLFIAGSLPETQRYAFASDEQELKKAPDFTLLDINGSKVLLSDFKDKIILVDFWATWCHFCRSSIPILMSLQKEYRDKGVEIVGIALEHDGGKILRQFIEKNRITYPIAIGDEELAKKYSAFGVPTRFLINREGKIVEKFIGYQEKEVFESAIKKLIK